MRKNFSDISFERKTIKALLLRKRITAETFLWTKYISSRKRVIFVYTPYLVDKNSLTLNRRVTLNYTLFSVKQSVQNNVSRV
uniref:Uncharacterized protein n=1 Tax=Acidianus sulfidivorans JP7 TaxID=619593 RepID=A0A2U9IPG3_9CREN